MGHHERELIIMSCLIYIVKYKGGGVRGISAETTHQNRAKRPTLKSGRHDPGRNDRAETTHETIIQKSLEIVYNILLELAAKFFLKICI